MSMLKDIVDRLLFPNRDVHAIPVLDGAFSPNRGLEQGTPVGEPIRLADDAVRGNDGALYVSSGCEIVRCTGPNRAQRLAWTSLDGPVGGLACNRSGGLLACVSGVGLVALDPSGREVGRLTQAGGTPLACPTAVTVSDDGIIYVTDGSRRNPPEDWLPDLMSSAEPSGRIVACASDLSQARVLLDGVSWPNGVVVSHDDKELWFTEGWAHTLKAVDRQTGKQRTIVKNFAGYPGRINRGTDRDYWLSFFAVRTELVEFVIREKAFCARMMAKVPRELWIGPALAATGGYLEPTQLGGIKKLGIQKAWAPPRSYGLVARLDEDGEPIESWHSRVGGHFHGVTATRVVGDDVIAVSKGHHRLIELPVSGRMPQEELV